MGHLFTVFALTFAFVASANGTTFNPGAYLVKIAGCADCHTVSTDQPFAGGLRINTPFGVFFTPNITPDIQTGIGNWTQEEFQSALRNGVSPHGSYYYPSFPYRSYTKIADEDAVKIWSYLRSLRPIHKENRPQQLVFPYSQRWGLFFWQQLFFRGSESDYLENIKSGYGAFTSFPSRSAEWNRGAYIAEALAHCTECHTPRNSLTGALETSMWMAGSDLPMGGRVAPNITTDRITGKGKWTRRDWDRFLLTGRNPSGEYPSGEMAQVINNTSALTQKDRDALAVYMMSLEPVRRGENVP